MLIDCESHIAFRIRTRLGTVLEIECSKLLFEFFVGTVNLLDFALQTVITINSRYLASFERMGAFFTVKTK
jgi:hypothetical protein